MSRKVFTAGEVLAAADVNTFLMNQSVMSFAGTASRGSAIPTPIEGMTTYLEDTDVLQIWNGSIWKAVGGSGVLQTQSAFAPTTSSNNTLTFNDATGLSVSITPSSATSKVLVSAHVQWGAQTATNIYLKLFRDATEIAQGDTAGSRTRVFAHSRGIDQFDGGTLSTNYLDSPATTSAVTYKVQFASFAAGSFVYINRTHDDANLAARPRMASTITVMEIA